MRSRRNRSAPRGEVSFNFTPMIDLVFTLSMFYMLVSKFHSAEQVRMSLPRPDQSQARVEKIPDRVMINCLPSEDPLRGDGVQYALGANPPEPLPEVIDRLTNMRRQAPDLKVIIRADRRLAYAEVRRVMQALARHRIEVLNVVALAGEGG
jgi:biopolymer transport protein ExbD